MKLPRSAWVLAGVAALAVLGFFTVQRDNTALRERVVSLTRQTVELRREADLALENARLIERRAVELDSQLAAAKTRKSSNDSQGVQLVRELNETRSQLSEREQRETALMAELSELRQAVASANSVGPVGASTEVAAANRRIAQLESQLSTPPAPTPVLETVVPAAPTPNYTVVRVGPRDSFVVIDYGSDHGAGVGRLLMLRRGTNTVAYVRISDARPNFSVAQVLPDSLKGQLQPGDFVVLAP